MTTSVQTGSIEGMKMARIVEVLRHPFRFLRKHGARGFVSRAIGRSFSGVTARRRENTRRLTFEKIRVIREDDGLSISFGPSAPTIQMYCIVKICRALSLRIIQGSEGQIRMAWDDTTVPKDLPIGAINSRCENIGKAHVANVFSQTFGYDLSVDPRLHSEKCVEKSDENGMHDGSIVECPREPRDGYVYQHVVDNRVGHLVEDLRVAVIGSEIPLVYLLCRPVHERFANFSSRAVLKRPEEMLSSSEISKILDFAREIRLDYGELDVLRNRKDNRIYIVDVAKTPFGPPIRLPLNKRLEAIQIQAEAFNRQFVQSVLA